MFPYLRIVLVVLIITLFSLLGGCDLQRENVVPDNTCSPPCWRNISPGITKQEELIEVLEQMPDIDQGTFRFFGSHTIFDSVIGVSLKPNVEIEFYLEDDTVILILVYGRVGLTYSEAVDIFGDPDLILATSTLGPSRFLFGDSPYLFISSMLPNTGVGFGFLTPDMMMNSAKEIDPESMITYFFYYDPGAYDRLLEDATFTLGNNEFKLLRSNQK